MDFIIIALVLIILGGFVVYSLMHRAKYDPESFENKFFRDFELYEAEASRGGNMIVKRSDRPAYPDLNDPKYMVAWAKENAKSSGLADKPIHWIVDDCGKFIQREIRRGRRYDGIIMDPPSYGRGPKGEIWKIEESIFPFVQLCEQLLSEDPLFFLINSYTTGLQPAVLTYMLETVVKKNHGGFVEASEIGLPVSSNGLVLPCGASGRWHK